MVKLNTDEARRAVIEAARLALFRCRTAASDQVSWHINSRDLQRHFTYLPEYILTEFGIRFPNSALEFITAQKEFPSDNQFYELVAVENGW